jgi:hypothetical protein
MTTAYGKWKWGKGTYSAPIDLVGAVAPAMTFSGTMAFPNMLSGDLPVAVTVSDALLTLQIPLSGGFAPRISLDGHLPSILGLAGDLPFTIVIGATDMHVGPLWTPIEICAPVDWQESVLCNG